MSSLLGSSLWLMEGGLHGGLGRVCVVSLTAGNVVVPVANCGVQEYNSNPKEHMPLQDYLAYWQDYIQLGGASPKGCLYLKDWHLCR